MSFPSRSVQQSLQSCFNILEKEYALESLKVRAMFDHIHTSHPALIATVAMVKGKRENKESLAMPQTS